MAIIIQYRTDNDRNGNSREIFAFYGNHGTRRYFIPYYNGIDCVPLELQAQTEGAAVDTIKIFPSEFRRIADMAENA